jgi:hypothetical protein
MRLHYLFDTRFSTTFLTFRLAFIIAIAIIGPVGNLLNEEASTKATLLFREVRPDESNISEFSKVR